MSRWALGVEYVGTAFQGWQAQPGARTVQSTLEQALASVAAHPVCTRCAGRTDKGVHAVGQVVHFDTTASRDQRAWVQGVNSLLPWDVRVMWAQAVSQDFHARFSAVSRTYRYRVVQRDRPMWRHRAWWVPHALHIESMQQAMRYWLGEHDFAVFRGAGCQSASSLRRVDAVHLEVGSAGWILTITANAFLHHMVRYMVGTLVRVGRGVLQPARVRAWLRYPPGERNLVGMAPPDGLSLVHVAYPAHVGVPSWDPMQP